jgi:hypothetical protein
MCASCLPLLHLHHFFSPASFCPLQDTTTQPTINGFDYRATSCSAFLRHQHDAAVRHGGSPWPESTEGLLFNASKGQISILTPLQSFFLYSNYL